MCADRRLDSRSRIILGVGNLCLFTGLATSLLATDFGRHHHAVYNGLRFGLLFMAIALNYWAFRSSHRGHNGAA